MSSTNMPAPSLASPNRKHPSCHEKAAPLIGTRVGSSRRVAVDHAEPLHRGALHHYGSALPPLSAPVFSRGSPARSTAPRSAHARLVRISLGRTRQSFWQAVGQDHARRALALLTPA